MSAIARTCILQALANGRPATSASVAQRLRVSIPKVELWLGAAVYDADVNQSPRRVGKLSYSPFQLSATGREKAKALTV